MNKNHAYDVLAFYIFTPIADPHEEIRLHKEFFKTRDVASRIYISEQGINGQMSALHAHAQEYMDWMHSRSPFQDLYFKVHTWHENVFPRKTVKYREKLVAIDSPFAIENGGEHVSPLRWKEMLEDNNEKLLIDVRNDYEWEVGHFEGSELPNCSTFREFDQYAEDLKKRPHATDTPVMMCCTGGIRCEIYSAILKERGFKQVYQLDGGIINYGLEVGNDHWKGKLFVFDDRLTTPICEEEAEVISKCHHCGTSCESYYNCANMDCNELFLCCPECLKKLDGCCQESCKEAPRVRPYHHQNPHKPFRKAYTYRMGKAAVTPA